MKRFSLIFILFLTAIIGFSVGRFTGHGSLLMNTNEHRVFPLLPSPPKPTPVVKINDLTKSEKDIIIEEPVDGVNISDAVLEISGRAKKGGPIHVFIKDAGGVVLADSFLTVEVTSSDGYGRFAKTITFEDYPSGNGTMEIFREGDGYVSKEKIVRTIIFGNSDIVTVKVFLSRGITDMCSVVFPTERKVSRKNSIYRAAIEELFLGPTSVEKTEGFTTSLPSKVILKSIAADADGIVTADFSSALNTGLVGACRSETVRTQIESTLKQFPEVHGVVILINGKVDEVLQP